MQDMKLPQNPTEKLLLIKLAEIEEDLNQINKIRDEINNIQKAIKNGHQTGNYVIKSKDPLESEIIFEQLIKFKLDKIVGDIEKTLLRNIEISKKGEVLNPSVRNMIEILDAGLERDEDNIETKLNKQYLSQMFFLKQSIDKVKPEIRNTYDKLRVISKNPNTITTKLIGENDETLGKYVYTGVELS